jgi:hypothetical protein
VRGRLASHRLGSVQRTGAVEVRTSLTLDLFATRALAFAKAAAGCLDALPKPGIVLQTVIEPIVLGLKTDQNAGGLAVPQLSGAKGEFENAD